MPRIPWWTVSAFAIWTMVLWVQRIVNSLTNDALAGVEQAVRVGITGVFLVLAVCLMVVHWQSRFYPIGVARSGLVRVIAAWTIGYWSVRALGFFYRDFNFTFTGAHLVMALISGALAIAAVVATIPPAPVSSASPGGTSRNAGQLVNQ